MSISRPPTRFFDIYKTFVVLAVVGQQKAADGFRRAHEREINRVARYLTHLMPAGGQTCYRGLLIEPGSVIGNQVAGQFQGATYMCLSEDLEVACWFSDTDAEISGYKMQLAPTCVGWIAEHVSEDDDILFHYSWTDYLNTLAPGPTLYQVMGSVSMQLMMHPQEAVMQLQWNLKTQQEVTLKMGIPLTVRRVESYNCPDTPYLDDKYRPRPDFILAPAGLQGLGIQPSEKLNIIRAQYPDPHNNCPMCGDPGISIIYYLDRANLRVLKCSTCRQNSFIA